LKHYRSIIFFSVIFLTLVSYSCTSLPDVARHADEKYICDLVLDNQATSTFRISPDNLTLTYIKNLTGQQVLVVNGKEQKRYAEVFVATQVFSPDSKHTDRAGMWYWTAKK
jgi:hypothetical protein